MWLIVASVENFIRLQLASVNKMKEHLPVFVNRMLSRSLGLLIMKDRCKLFAN